MAISRFSVLVFTIFVTANLVAAKSGDYNTSEKDFYDSSALRDTLKDNQLLYNGRIWRNLYYNVDGDQFLFSKTFLPGSVVIRGKAFEAIGILYDILKDEILIPLSTGGVLQVNKEMVDSFSFNFQNKVYPFARIQLDSLNSYVQVIYRGKTGLYKKYTKKIEKLAEQGKYDKFYQISQTYFVKDNKFYPITGKSDLLKILQKEDKELVNNFIRKNKLKISKTNPESFIPVLRYLDTILP